MREIFEQYKKDGDIHHFYLLEGDRNFLKQEINNFLIETLKVDINDKNLFYSIDFDRFLVDDAREIISRSQIKTPLNKRMIFVLSINSINREAQNSLLKLLEEPTDRTYFFIILPRVNNLLNTFISRSIIIRNVKKNADNSLNMFRKMAITDRMKFVEDLSRSIKLKKVEKIEAQKLVRNLIEDLSSEIQEGKNLQKNRLVLKALLKIEDYLNDSGASIKILLERAILLI